MEPRRDHILARLYEFGRVEVRNLAQAMSVSEATIRRDLRALADEGALELVYGGATLPRATDFSFLSKAQRNQEAKRVIGRMAADLIADHSLLYLDSGTTCFEMCQPLRSKRGLSVIVNSVRLVTELGKSPDTNVIMIAGQYRADRMDIVGPLASATIEQLRGYQAFIGADGLGMDFGITAGDIDTAHLVRQVIRNAREAILVIDHTKFMTPSLFKLAEFDSISRIVTDQRPQPEWMEFLSGKEIEVIYPAESASSAQSA